MLQKIIMKALLFVKAPTITNLFKFLLVVFVTMSCGGKVDETAITQPKTSVAQITAPKPKPISRFDSLLTILPSIDVPHSFHSRQAAAVAETALPIRLIDLKEYGNEWKICAKVHLQKNYPLIMIKRFNSEMDTYDAYSLLSFDSTGRFISELAVKFNSDGQGRKFSITPDKRIRVAVYGASEAIIRSYEYANGQFKEVGEAEDGDIDNMPEY